MKTTCGLAFKDYLSTLCPILLSVSHRAVPLSAQYVQDQRKKRERKGEKGRKRKKRDERVVHRIRKRYSGKRQHECPGSATSLTLSPYLMFTSIESGGRAIDQTRRRVGPSSLTIRPLLCSYWTPLHSFTARLQKFRLKFLSVYSGG
jgi:hypothetical protein